MVRRTAACLALAAGATLVGAPAHAVRSPGANTSCTVFVVNTGGGTSSGTCTYLAVGTSGTLTAVKTGGTAVASVRCTVGGAGVLANGAVTFTRTGFCLVTLTLTSETAEAAAATGT